MAKREAAGKTYSSDDSDEERLPDESVKKQAIPEDDPDYYSKVHDPYEDDHRAHGKDQEPGGHGDGIPDAEQVSQQRSSGVESVETTGQ